jgi:hypothetical protein
MASRRDQITMAPDGDQGFLDEQRTLAGRVDQQATARPHLVAMWYARHDGEILRSGPTPSRRRS